MDLNLDLNLDFVDYDDMIAQEMQLDFIHQFALRTDPLEQDDIMFYSNYKFRKDSVIELCHILYPHIDDVQDPPGGNMQGLGFSTIQVQH